jgi:hypothetical protein
VAGDAYLAMTGYIRAIQQKSPEQGVAVLTNMKSSIDAYAFLNAYVFQFENATLYPYSLDKKKIEQIDRLMLFPHKYETEVRDFIGSRRVDYIVLPTERTPWIGSEQAPDSREAIRFFDRFPGYRQMYSDEYYHVYKQE